MQGIRGKRVLITGGSSGIGKAVALRLVAEGASVAVNYLDDADSAEAIAQEARQQHAGGGGDAFAVQGDVADESAVAAMLAQVIERFGGIDVLVNNAGIQSQTPTHEMTAEEWDRVIRVNLRGAFLCCRDVLAHWVQRNGGGTIINVSSVHETIPRPLYAHYAASKGGVGNLTRTLALEYAAHNIRVNAVAPGATDTPIQSWHDDEQAKRRIAEGIPIRRIATPEQIAGPITFLISDDATYITGATLTIDGGLTLYPRFQPDW